MTQVLRLPLSQFVLRLRSRAKLELENLVLRHQIEILRRSAPKRARLVRTECYAKPSEISRCKITMSPSFVLGKLPPLLESEFSGTTAVALEAQLYHPLNITRPMHLLTRQRPSTQYLVRERADKPLYYGERRLLSNLCAVAELTTSWSYCDDEKL